MKMSENSPISVKEEDGEIPKSEVGENQKSESVHSAPKMSEKHLNRF